MKETLNSDILELEFEIDKKASNIVKETRKKMTEKIEECIDMLDGILQPDTASFAQMHEANFFGEKESTTKLYKKLMQFYRYALEASYSLDESKETEFVDDFFKQWKSIKEEMSEIAAKLKECWKKESEEEEDLRYLG